jgi:hypothetical protein
MQTTVDTADLVGGSRCRSLSSAASSCTTSLPDDDAATENSNRGNDDNHELDQPLESLLHSISETCSPLQRLSHTSSLLGLPPESVVWAHGVNTPSQLHHALRDGTNFIEADVCWNTASAVPVMRHSSYSSRPLSEEFAFTDFVHTFITCNFKVLGLKLDFKSGASILPCMHVLRDCQFHLPVWLNADICKGPGGLEPSVAPNEVFETVHMDFMKSLDITLSIGWTTFFPFFSTSKYTASHVAELRREIDANYIPCHVAITFPVRASFARASWSELLKLLDPTWRPKTSLTMWTAVEGVPQADLDWLREESKRCGVTVFFDVDKGSKAAWWSRKRVAFYVGASGSSK